jgi:hypothetical protein
MKMSKSIDPDLKLLELIAEKLAADLVQMHKDTAIELQYWEHGLRLVDYFYNTYSSVEIGKKKL